MRRKKKATSKQVNSDDDVYVEKYCACGVWQEYGYVGCDVDGCESWWHTCCVGFGTDGLKKEWIDAVELWTCPKCVVKQFAKGVVSTKEEIAQTVKEEIQLLLPDIVKTVAKETEKSAGPTWAALFKDEQLNNKEAAKKQAEDAKKQAQKVEDAIRENRAKMLADNLERERRKRNVVVSHIPESPYQEYNKRQMHEKQSVMAILRVKEPRIDPQDIVSVVRAGPRPGTETQTEGRKFNGPRQMIVKMKTPHIAEHLHNYGAGTPIRMGSDGIKGKITNWINEDLIQADRKSNFDARELKRLQKEKKENNLSKPSSLPITVVPQPSTSVVIEAPTETPTPETPSPETSVNSTSDTPSPVTPTTEKSSPETPLTPETPLAPETPLNPDAADFHQKL